VRPVGTKVFFSFLLGGRPAFFAAPVGLPPQRKAAAQDIPPLPNRSAAPLLLTGPSPCLPLPEISPRHPDFSPTLSDKAGRLL